MQNNYFDANHPLRPYTHSLPAMPGTHPPANALRGEAPVAQPGFHPGEKNGRWIEIEDHRGKNGYVNGLPCEIKGFGPLPDGWGDTKPAPSPEEMEQQRRSDIMNRLLAIDLESVRPLRALAGGEASEEDTQKLSALNEEAALLRKAFRD